MQGCECSLIYCTELCSHKDAHTVQYTDKQTNTQTLINTHAYSTVHTHTRTQTRKLIQHSTVLYSTHTHTNCTVQRTHTHTRCALICTHTHCLTQTRIRYSTVLHFIAHTQIHTHTHRTRTLHKHLSWTVRNRRHSNKPAHSAAQCCAVFHLGCVAVCDAR
jgi:hypothetical protein